MPRALVLVVWLLALVWTTGCVKTTTETTSEAILYESVVRDDPSMWLGDSRTNPGAEGTLEITWSVKRRGDKVIERTRVSERIVQDPADEVVLNGLKNPATGVTFRCGNSVRRVDNVETVQDGGDRGLKITYYVWDKSEDLYSQVNDPHRFSVSIGTDLEDGMEVVYRQSDVVPGKSVLLQDTACVTYFWGGGGSYQGYVGSEGDHFVTYELGDKQPTLDNVYLVDRYGGTIKVRPLRDFWIKPLD